MKKKMDTSKNQNQKVWEWTGHKNGKIKAADSVYERQANLWVYNAVTGYCNQQKGGCIKKEMQK